MRFQTPLLRATLLRRYKRFLADIRLEDGREATAHCANPGAMTGLARPGARIWVEPNDDRRKKLSYAWRLVDLGDGRMAGVDTSLPNRLLRAALADGAVPDLSGYGTVLPEQRYGTASRVDFLLRDAQRRDAYVEVKSVTLHRQHRIAEFPDTVTERGARHLGELADMARAGHRAVLFYIVQRNDCEAVGVAADIDPAYAAALQAATSAGVEVLAYDTELSPQGVSLRNRLPVIFGDHGTQGPL